METISNIVVGRIEYSLVGGATETHCPNRQQHNFWSDSSVKTRKGVMHWKCRYCGSTKID